MRVHSGKHAAVETVMAETDLSSLPVHHIVSGGGSPVLYERFRVPRPAAAGSSTTIRLSPDPFLFLWQLLDERRLLVQLLDLSGTMAQPIAAVVLAFDVPLMPVVTCIHNEAGLMLSALTGTGELHTFTIDPVGAKLLGLLAVLTAEGTARCAPLGPQLQRLGRPSALMQLPGFVCIGTEDGNVLCLPTEGPRAAPVELRHTGALVKVRPPLPALCIESACSELRALAPQMCLPVYHQHRRLGARTMAQTGLLASSVVDPSPRAPTHPTAPHQPLRRCWGACWAGAAAMAWSTCSS